MQLLENALNLFVTNAYAAEAAQATAAQQGGSFSLILMMVVFIAFMYFVMWRPQSKRAKDHRNLISALGIGDEVVTAGGILGRIAKVSDQYVTLLLTDNVEIIVQKSSIVTALPKGTLKSIV